MNIYSNGITVQGYYDDMEIKVDNPLNDKTIAKIIKKVKQPKIQKVLLLSYFGNVKSINLELI